MRDDAQDVAQAALLVGSEAAALDGRAFNVADGDPASGVLESAAGDLAMIQSAMRDDVPPVDITFDEALHRVSSRIYIGAELHRRQREALLVAEQTGIDLEGKATQAGDRARGCLEI